jgi:hypothetical protein
MKKTTLILSLIFLFSCGSRKVENTKTETKEVIKTDSIVKIIEEIKIKIDTKKDIEKNEFTYTPIDIKSEFIIDGKVYKNVRIRHAKVKDNTNVKELKTIAKNKDIAVKKKTKDRIDTVLKISDKKGLDIGSKIGIIIIAIGIIIGLGYLYVRK